MKIEVRYFASLRESAGASAETIETAATDLAALYAELQARHGFTLPAERLRAAIEAAIARILRAGKAPGILTTDEAQARHYLALGAVFVAVGLDTGILARQTSALAAKFKNTPVAPVARGAVY